MLLGSSQPLTTLCGVRPHCRWWILCITRCGWLQFETVANSSETCRKCQKFTANVTDFKLYELRFPLEPLLSKGVFMPRNICCLDVYEIQERQTISMQTLATSWHRSLVVYIKRAVLSMIICKQQLWNQWETIKILIRYNNNSHLGTSRACYLILTLQKLEALWIEISDALLWHKRWI